MNVVEKENGFFDIRYSLTDPGDYLMNVKFGGKDIPNGSFTFKVSVIDSIFKVIKIIDRKY